MRLPVIPVCGSHRPLAVWLSVVIALLCLGGGMGTAQNNGSAPQEPSASPDDRITLNVKETDIADVLKFLSLQRRVNIVAGKDVSGTVSINLYDVPFDMALEVILQANGLTSYRQGNVIFVTAAARRPDGLVRPVVTTTRTFRLNYVNIDEAAEMVHSLMSPAGKMVIGKATKTLFLEDTSETLEKIAVLLGDLDIKPRQVLIEAKILELTLNNDTTLGIDWAALFGIGGRAGTAAVQGFATNPATGAAGFFFSVVGQDASVLLSALQERGHLNTIARPKILALDGQEAQILIGSKLGFRVTTTTETSTLESVEFLDVGTELVIKPYISDDGHILMHVHPKVSDGVIEAGLPSETTTEATTSVLVKDGETIIIGGLIRQREEEINTQIPALGDLPLLGALFRRRTVTRLKTEIAVLITPRIVKDALADATILQDGDDRLRIGKIWDAEFIMALSNSL